MSKPFHAEDHQMSFTQHLGELRTRLLIASLAVIFCSIFGFTYAKEIIGFLMGPLKEATAGTNIQPDLHYLSLTEPLFQSFKIALFAGIFFAFPVWVWQAWLFIAPGLHPNERRLIGPVLTSSILLFVAGATFAYKIAVPSAYRFLLIYASPLQAQPAAPVRQGGLTLELLPIPTPPHTPQTKTPSKRPVLQIDLPALQQLFAASTLPSPSPIPSAHKTPTPSTLPTHQHRPSPSATRTAKKTAASAQKIPLKPILRLRAKNLYPPTDPKRVDLLQAVQSLLRQKSIDLQFSGSPQRFQLRYQWDYPHASEDAWGQLKPNLTLQAYLGISSWFLLGFGIVFQTPLVIFLLGVFGIAPPELLAQYRRHAFVLILIISSVLTPTGDPLNLMIMALPMYILFEIGLAFSRVFLRNRKDNDSSGTPPSGTPPSSPTPPPPPSSPIPPAPTSPPDPTTYVMSFPPPFAPSSNERPPEEAQIQEQQAGDIFLQNELTAALFAHTAPPLSQTAASELPPSSVPIETSAKPPALPPIRPPDGYTMPRGSLTQTDPLPPDPDEFIEEFTPSPTDSTLDEISQTQPSEASQPSQTSEASQPSQSERDGEIKKKDGTP